ncbi:hypothetical protein GE107_07445 [Cohnella sp. CFH 77786]|uniref:hypothetical protein n=1 Tax=Cohnella sp. CFH 77786 TaxID=2662265 RepID=UPI001C60C4AE|nr:hypothetical protein [Cohnella sp. CFH 77786]MBW5445891.1 hypothetical protein [Cohnella sp. CFH 77786]
MSSSTSNSKKKLWRRFGWGFVGFVVLFAAAEIFVFRDLDFYAMEYRSSVGQFAELDYSFRHSKPDKVNVAIFGDSQSKDALRPDLLAAASGRSPDSIFNFSISGGKAFDIYHTYLKYEDFLPNLKEAIVVVNEHQINSFNMENDEKYRFYAGLQDRIRIMNWDNYGELTMGWVSKAFDMRGIWSRMLKSYFNGTLPKKTLAEVYKPGGLRAETQLEKDGLTPAYAEKRADGWFEQYDTAGLQTDSLEALLHDLHARGVRIVILQIPRSELFEETVKRKYPAEQQEYFDIISTLAKKYGAEFTVMSNEGLTLKNDFRDTNHVRPKGADIVSAEVAKRWLK